VITAGDGQEISEEFHDLVQKLCADYQPVGVVEELLVQTIATCWWRKARVIRAENGEIRKRVDTLIADRVTQGFDKASLDLALSHSESRGYLAGSRADQQVSTRERWFALQNDQLALREHPVGLANLRELLMTAKSQMASDGYISDTVRKRIVAVFSLWDFSFALTCFEAGPPEAKKEGRISEQFADRPLSMTDWN
jgi:hypothetical protein